MTSGWRRGSLRGGSHVPRPLVVKLGGSMLERPAWAHEVAAVLDALPAPRVLVVGGGPLVDGLRAIDRAEPKPADLMHRLAIECMGNTARLVALALAAPLVSEPASSGPETVVLDVPAWLAHDGRFESLPIGWHVTSDSIAAVVATARAAGLLLVKSVPPPEDDLERLADAGWVDGFFPTASQPLAWIGWAAPE